VTEQLGGHHPASQGHHKGKDRDALQSAMTISYCMV